uniref:DUF1618 domain-containing protein n=1 Tax=Oryza punctata TaxID=4537 RepID=A0A0E0K763_ORYPU
MAWNLEGDPVRDDQQGLGSTCAAVGSSRTAERPPPPNTNLRVPHPNDELHRGIKSYDYFVYSLRLLLNPRVFPFRNEEVVIVRCSGGTRYVIAGLIPTINHPMDFKLRRFDSDAGRWKSRRLLLIPDTASEVLFHCTTKVITLGGAIGWRDPVVRVCDDMLDEHPVLPDLLLPKPARRNWKSFCRGPPHYYRDITVVVQDSAPSCIEYVETVTRHLDDGG